MSASGMGTLLDSAVLAFQMGLVSEVILGHLFYLYPDQLTFIQLNSCSRAQPAWYS